jgi:hypothetical protein
VTRLPDLRDALVAAAARQSAPATPSEPLAPRHRLRRRLGGLPVLIAVVLSVLGLAAVAFAASTLIPSGTPVKTPAGLRFTPTSGLGVAVPASVRRLAITVPDPTGGPPWGARYVRTSRGLGCLLIGRIVGGRLGVLGQDGAFNDDGRFHELPPDYLDPLGCTTLDAHGHAFLASTVHGMLASAATGLTPSGCKASSAAPVGQRKLAPCPLADERLVSYGLLGPEARSISYEQGSAIHTMSVRPPWGAYLVVQPLFMDRTASRGSGWWRIATLGGPSSKPILQVRYAGGRVCRVAPANRRGGARACVVGRVLSSSPAPTAAQLTSPVTVKLGGTRRVRLPDRQTVAARQVTLSFEAHVAAPDAHSQYGVELREPRGRSCGHATRISAIDHDVRRGQQVHTKLVIEHACRGTWTGSVRYTPPSSRASLNQLIPEPPSDSVMVGRFSFRIP